MKIGLVLEGGAMRGMFTAGVLDVFLDNEIEVDKIIGVSAGVLFGVNFLSEQKGRAIRYNKKFIKDKRYMGLYSLLKTGNIVGKEFTFYEIPQKLDIFDDETFKNSKTEFYATVTNVDTGEAEYMRIDSVLEEMEILRATSAMPYVSNFVELDGKKYLDGAIADSIPVEKCKEMGCDKIIVVLTRTADYRKTDTESKFANIVYKDYPKFVSAIEKRHEIYNSTIEKINEMEANGEIFVIRPSKNLHIKRIEKDLDKLQAMYDLGIEDATSMVEELKKYLEK